MKTPFLISPAQIRRATIAIVGLTCVAGSAADEADLTPIIDPIRRELSVPGLAAAVVRDGKTMGIGVCGVRELNKPGAVAADDLLMIGSCGKSATRLLIGRLLDKNLLRLDSKLGELLADVPMRDEYREVTIAEILAHRGGIPAYTEISPSTTPVLFDAQGSPTERRSAFVSHLLKSDEPAAPHGSKFVYSNAGYGLLGHIAERLLKKPFEVALREEVFLPLGMKSALVGMPYGHSSRPGFVGHSRTPDGYRPAPPRAGLAAIAPAGLMSMSILDFATFAAALARIEAGQPGEFLSKSMADAIREVRPGDKSGEGEIFFGGDGHFTAAFALWPSKQVAIVVGSNAGDCDEICQRAIDALRDAVAKDVPARDPQQNPPADGEQRPRYGFGIGAENDDLIVAQVYAGSVAEKAGLREGDKIIAINGKQLRPENEIELRAQARKSPLELTIERDGKRIVLKMELPGATSQPSTKPR